LDIAHGYTFEDGVLGEINQPEGLALALGFCLSEGIIQSLQDLKSVAVCPDNTGVIRIQLLDPPHSVARPRECPDTAAERGDQQLLWHLRSAGDYR
jgi:FdhD protein